MAYQVVKTVKGHKYLYLQRSYREGGRVRTESQYLGAVDSSGALNKAAPPPDTHHNRPSDKPLSGNNELSLQKPAFKLKEKYLKISEAGYTREYQRHVSRLQSMGVGAEHFPRITIKHSTKGYGYHKAAFKNEIVVTAPKGQGNREKLRKAYREALHHSFINTLERKAPDQLHPFKYAFDTSYQRTQDALTNYLRNCNSSGSFARIVALKWFCRMNPVPTGKRSKLKPEQLGIVEYGNRKDWKQEYSVLMAEIDKKGTDKLRKQAQAEIAKATRTQQNHIKKKSFFWIRRRRTIKRQQAKIQANREMLNKLDLVERWVL